MVISLNEATLKELITKCAISIINEGRTITQATQKLYTAWVESGYDTLFMTDKFGYSIKEVIRYLMSKGVSRQDILRNDKIIANAYNTIKQGGDISSLDSMAVSVAKSFIRMDNKDAKATIKLKNEATPERKIARRRSTYTRSYPSAVQAMKDGYKQPMIVARANEDIKKTHAEPITRHIIEDMYKVFGIERRRGRLPMELRDNYQDIVNSIFPLFAKGWTDNKIAQSPWSKVYGISTPTIKNLRIKYNEYIQQCTKMIIDEVESFKSFRVTKHNISIWLDNIVTIPNGDDIKHVVLKSAFNVDSIKELNYPTI